MDDVQRIINPFPKFNRNCAIPTLYCYSFVNFIPFAHLRFRRNRKFEKQSNDPNESNLHVKLQTLYR